MMRKALGDGEAWKHSGANLWNLLAIGAFVALGLIVFNDEVASVVAGENENRSLVVRDLRFEQGHFLQIVVPDHGTEPLMADWTAHITQPGETYEQFICGSGGRAPYKPRILPARMTADEWAGASCDLTEGQTYRATAQWRWPMPDGGFGRISQSIDFVYNAPEQ